MEWDSVTEEDRLNDVIGGLSILPSRDEDGQGECQIKVVQSTSLVNFRIQSTTGKRRPTGRRTGKMSLIFVTEMLPGTLRGGLRDSSRG